MKHIIEFNLPEEKEELSVTMQAQRFHSALWDFSQQIRQWRKYDDLETIEIEKVSNAFYEILKDNEVEL